MPQESIRTMLQFLTVNQILDIKLHLGFIPKTINSNSFIHLIVSPGLEFHLFVFTPKQ